MISDIAIIEDTKHFRVVEEEWEDLYRNAPLATPSQSWAWLYSWWEHYGEGYELRLVTVRNEEGLLVGVLPLVLECRWGLGRLLFIGTGRSDNLDMLARKGWEAQVAEAGREALRDMGSWRVADLQELRPEAAAWDLLRRWDGFRTSVWQSNRVVIDVKPWDELLMSVSKRLRNNARRALRRAEADGVRCELVSVDEAEQAARRLVALSREQRGERWQETNPELWTRRFEAHLETAARRMTASGLGVISEFRQDEEVIGSEFLVIGAGYVGAHMMGASQEALRQYEISALTAYSEVKHACDLNVTYVSLGRGDEPYKLRWGYETSPNHRVFLARSRIFWGPYGGYYVLRYGAKRYAYSENAPPWIKRALAVSRTLRRMVSWRLTSKNATPPVDQERRLPGPIYLYPAIGSMFLADAVGDGVFVHQWPRVGRVCTLRGVYQRSRRASDVFSSRVGSMMLVRYEQGKPLWSILDA